MSAYAALVSLMNDLELIPNHPTYSFSFDNKQISSLSQTVNSLIEFMETYDSHGCSRDAAEALEGRIASAAHAAHDVIESHVVDRIHSGSILRETRSSFLPDLQKAIDKMIVVERKTYHLEAKRGMKAEQPPYSVPTSSEPLTSGKILVDKFDDVLVRLVDIITRVPSSERVIPIVGMGGIGKTTLAKKAFEHSYVEHHFDLRLWATLSQDYSVNNILEQLLSGKRKSTAPNDSQLGELKEQNDSQLEEQNYNRLGKQEDSLLVELDKKSKSQLRKDKINKLGEELHKMLWGRRYLIVLDNMWSVRAWEEIQMYFRDRGNGSHVIVTTRLSNLAAHLSSSPFEMNFLDDDKSWELFCEKTFGEQACPAELEETGKKILKRCGGLPLSIVVIGGHLRRSSDAIKYWEKVANYLNPISSSVADEQCLDILSLSYHYLPVYLKPCFLYMGIFHEGELICASKLLQLWVAEGFLKAEKGISLEKVGESHLQDLIDRNLILIHEKMWNGKVKICGVHDNVRELCLKVGKQEKFLRVLEDTIQAIDKERRIVILKRGHHPYHVVQALQSAPLVRSLVCHGEQVLRVGQLLSSFRLLRLSDYAVAYGVNDDDCFPPADLQHVNLRHLAFYFQRNSERLLKLPLGFYYGSTSSERSLNLPSSIFLFWNLQSLTVKNYDEQITLPHEIWEISQLRYVELLGICLPDPLLVDGSNQKGRIVLKNLQTLKGVENLRLTEEVCKRMPDLKNLSLRYFDNSHSDFKADTYYCPHNLGRFIKLQSLKYELANLSLSFTFPSSLEELSLVDYRRHWKDLTVMIRSLPYLGSLDVDSVQGYEWDLIDVEFPRLKRLSISGCKDLIRWKADSSNFPVLEILNISRVPNLNEIPFDIGEIQTLRFIKLRGCNVSAAASAKRIVLEQESLGNEDLQLYVNLKPVNVSK